MQTVKKSGVLQNNTGTGTAFLPQLRTRTAPQRKRTAVFTNIIKKIRAIKLIRL
jgi:hypothetical protein